MRKMLTKIAMRMMPKYNSVPCNRSYEYSGSFRTKRPWSNVAPRKAGVAVAAIQASTETHPVTQLALTDHFPVTSRDTQ